MKKSSNIVTTFIKTNAKTLKLIAYIAIGFIVLKYAIILFTPKPQMPTDLKATIDSLTKANQALQAKQLAIDSTVARYENEVEIINGMIGGITEKTTVIREFYHEQSSSASKYTPTQVDSFFKSRYKY